MKNANINETKSRRRSSRGSSVSAEDVIASKAAKKDDLRQISDGLKSELKSNQVSKVNS